MANGFKVTMTPKNQSITLKNTTISQSRLDQLNDVVEEDDAKLNGSLLVYQASTDTYVLRRVLNYDATTDTYTFNGGGF
jgi:hypothetical protein